MEQDKEFPQAMAGMDPKPMAPPSGTGFQSGFPEGMGGHEGAVAQDPAGGAGTVDHTGFQPDPGQAAQPQGANPGNGQAGYQPGAYGIDAQGGMQQNGGYSGGQPQAGFYPGAQGAAGSAYSGPGAQGMSGMGGPAMNPQMGHPTGEQGSGYMGTSAKHIYHDENRFGQVADMVGKFIKGEANTADVVNGLFSLNFRDDQFWKGAIVGVLTAVVLTNDTVKQGLANTFGSVFSPKEKKSESDKEIEKTVSDKKKKG